MPLRWERVDVTKRRVEVRGSATEISGRLEWGTPKTHEVRTVILPRFVIESLGTPGDGLVFTARKGDRSDTPTSPKASGSPSLRSRGDARRTPHPRLRDTAASLAISAGASIKAVQQMLEHASAAMTLDTYGSLFEEDLEDLADQMDQRLRRGPRRQLGPTTAVKGPATRI